MIIQKERNVPHSHILVFRLVEHGAAEECEGIEQGGFAAGVATIHDTNLEELNTFCHFVKVLVSHLVIISRKEA